jgi:type VI protein secretion system component Hcp
VKYAEFSVIKQIDKSTPGLFQTLATGSTIKQMVFDASDATSGDQFEIQFALARLTSINWSGGGGEELPKEELTFAVAATGIKFTSQPTKP